MASPSTGRPSRTATHYQVLDLQPALLAGSGEPAPHDAALASLIRRAYRRALLRNHPDKAAGAGADADGVAHRPPSALFTVDQISDAYAVLSSPQRRREYDASLRLSRLAGVCVGVEAGEDGVLMVGCQDCSLWLKVHFAVVEE